MHRTNGFNDPVKARRLKCFAYCLAICCMLLISVYLVIITGYTGKGIRTFQMKIDFQTYVFVEADDVRYVIDETYNTLNGKAVVIGLGVLPYFPHSGACHCIRNRHFLEMGQVDSCIMACSKIFGD